ncbi:MAG: hypothetical protein ACYC3H_01495 [Bellilinea sp.]
MNNAASQKPGASRTRTIILLVITTLILVIATDLLLIRTGIIPAVDWKGAFRPAALAMLEGRSPYDAKMVFNPTWVFLPMIPLALLPVDLSSTIMFLVPFVGYAFAAYKFRARPGNILIFLANPLVYFGATVANIDWMIPLGAALPPQIGLFFVLSKPQIGIGIALFWLFEAYQSGGIKQVIKVFAPVTLVLITSTIVYGPYFLNGSEVIGAWWNFSLWPYAIPIGVALIISAIKNRDFMLAVASSGFLSPYLAPQSWAIAIFSQINNRAVLIGVVASSWVAWYLLVHR